MNDSDKFFGMTNEEYYELERDYARDDDLDYPPQSLCNDCGMSFDSNPISPIRCEACQAGFERYRRR